METTLTGTPRISIRGNWDIAVIETHIKDYLCHCEMWGDLNISLEEYDCIKEKIAGALGSNPSAKEVKAIFRKYPIVMVTDIISFVLFDYDNNEFWSGWASRFNIDTAINNQTEIGRMVREIFEKFEFKVIEDGGYVYVTPILCQAGIPSSCFDKLFDILDSTLNSSYFMAREIVSELMSYRSYLIDAPVERYFRLHTERAIELIVQLRQMMHAVGDLSVSRELTELPEVHSVEQRIVKRYAQWSAEIKKMGKKSRKNTQYYFSPKLIYDATKGICLFIPEQTLRQDSIYKLRWTIIGDGVVEDAKIVYSQVYADQNRNYTREANVPVEIANTYTIQLRDNDNDSVLLTNSWVVNGLGNSFDILTFNESGSLLPPTQRYIARKGTIVVFDGRRASITEINSINKVDVNLPYSWADLQAFCAYPTDKDARLTIQTLSEVICIESKKSFDIDLVQVGTLFDEKYKGNETPVYTRFPTVELNGNIGNYNPALLSYWSVVIIHRLSNTKHTAMLSELGFKVYGDCVRFSLGDYAQEYFEGMYGAYDLRIYDGKTRKYFVFYLSPKIDYVANVEDIKSDRSFGHRRAVFYLQKNDAVALEFENESGINSLPAPNMGVDWVEISTTNKRAYINGNLILKSSNSILKIPFKKTLRKLEWNFWDEHENDIEEVGKAKQFYLEDFKETTWRLALHFTNAADRYDVVKLVLEAANSDQLQSKEVMPDGFGNVSVILNLFQDTMAGNLLPQRLMLHISKGFEDYLPICIAVVKSYVQLKNPKYSLTNDRPTVYWDPCCENELLNKSLELISLNDLEMEPLKYPLTDSIRRFKGKGDKAFEGILLDKPLNDGIYYIEAREDLNFSFFDDEEQTAPVFNSDHILCVNGKQVLEKLFFSQSNLVVDWLSATTIALNKLDWIIALERRLRIQIEHGEMLFYSKACAFLLFSLIINSGVKSNLESEIKIKVKEVCANINYFLISNTHRLEILKLLLESSISDNDCKTMINELQLYLFCPNDSVIFDKLSVRRMWDINQEMAILMNLRNCVSNISVDMERVLTRIGNESLQEMIRVTPATYCDSNDWTYCIEQIMSGNCDCEYVSVECSGRVWGDGNEYSNLFVSDRKNNVRRLMPDESHTDGYEIFGKNYLTLIYELTPENQDVTTKQYVDNANKETYKVESLTSKYSPVFPKLHSALRTRLAGNAGIQKLFYQIGCSSALTALSSRKVINSADLQELLPFWKNAIGAYPQLVYRDMILSELHVLFEKGRVS